MPRSRVEVLRDRLRSEAAERGEQLTDDQLDDLTRQHYARVASEAGKAGAQAKRQKRAAAAQVAP